VGQLSGLLSNYQVSECTFCDNADISEQFTDTVNAEGKLSAWVVTMGLATSKLDAFGHLKNLARISNMNMLPEAVQLKKVERIKVISRWSGVSALTFVTALAILSYAVLYGRSEALVENISPLLQVEDKYNVEMGKLDQLRALKDRMDELNKIRGELPSNQKELLAAYNYLGESIPDGIWLKEITYEAPNAITIVGNSVDDQNILAFINSLNQSKDFGQVSLKTMQAVKEMSMNAQESLAVKKFELGGEFLPGVENGEATPAEKTPPAPATTTITTPAEKQ
jgi:Tfp pilus assembly protein PilN